MHGFAAFLGSASFSNSQGRPDESRPVRFVNQDSSFYLYSIPVPAIMPEVAAIMADVGAVALYVTVLAANFGALPVGSGVVVVTKVAAKFFANFATAAQSVSS